MNAVDAWLQSMTVVFLPIACLFMLAVIVFGIGVLRRAGSMTTEDKMKYREITDHGATWLEVANEVETMERGGKPAPKAQPVAKQTVEKRRGLMYH